ncbi:hypothetical protein [Novosphingobium sp. 9]|uniref:hypothetical protein n=1 Tax=Novosphingobium sp. 9 TaxID=2025349 RepID=UPI0021B53FA3|nr:hypothetical protein [Novosphingobium sp. 9]
MLALAMTMAGPAIAQSDQCLGGLTSQLIAGGFTGSTDCDHDHLTWHRLGQIRAGGRVFALFDYAYWLKPVCAGCAVHGGRRIVVMERRGGAGERYLGQYGPLQMGAVAAIRANRLRLQAASGAKAADIVFTRAGPPQSILYDGEVLSFHR